MKKVILLITSIVLTLSLAGCIRTDIGVTLNKNGTGSVCVSVGIEESAYNELATTYGANFFEGKTPIPEKYGDTTYMTVKETTSCSSYDEIKNKLLSLTYNTQGLGIDEQSSGVDSSTVDNHVFSSVVIDRTSGIFYSVYTFRATVNALQLDNRQLSNAFLFTITVNMPGKITQSIGAKPDGKSIVFDLTSSSSTNEIAAVSESYNYGLVIGICVAMSVAVAAFIIFIKRKK